MLQENCWFWNYGFLVKMLDILHTSIWSLWHWGLRWGMVHYYRHGQKSHRTYFETEVKESKVKMSNIFDISNRNYIWYDFLQDSNTFSSYWNKLTAPSSAIGWKNGTGPTPSIMCSLTAIWKLKRTNRQWNSICRLAIKLVLILLLLVGNFLFVGKRKKRENHEKSRY